MAIRKIDIITFELILRQLNGALEAFHNTLPRIQERVYEDVRDQVSKLELYRNGKIKPTVKNLILARTINRRILQLILRSDYNAGIRDLMKAYNELEELNKLYWKQLDSNFKPSSILKEIKEQAIDQVTQQLTEQGLQVNVADPIHEVLKSSVTSGGSYKSLTDQLKELLTNTEAAPGAIEKYAKQVTTDSLNQYNATYNQVVSSGLNYEWYKYDNSDIDTTRPFCDAMTDNVYFHIALVPALLKAKYLTYVNKKGERVPVPIYAKTGLPHGMIPGTDESNFFIRRGGYNCGHQIRPMNPDKVPDDRKLEVYGTPEYVEYFRKVTPQKTKLEAEEEERKKFAGRKDISKEVDALMAKAKDVAPEIDEIAQRISKKYGELVTPINLKSHPSITRKAYSEYPTPDGGGDVGRIKDAVRTTIIVRDPANIPKIIADLQKEPLFNPDRGGRVKTQDPVKDPFGYSGTIVNFPASNGIIAEIQVNTPPLIYAKERGSIDILGKELFEQIKKETGMLDGMGHVMYEQGRTLKPDDEPDPVKRRILINKLNDLKLKSRAYYKHFY